MSVYGGSTVVDGAVTVQISEVGPPPEEWTAALESLGCSQPSQTPGYFEALKADIVGTRSRAVVCIARRDGRISGIATVVIGPFEITYKIGERILFSATATSVRMVDPEPIAADVDTAAAMLREIMKLPHQVLVFERYAPEGDPWARVVQQSDVANTHRLYLPFGTTESSSIRLPGSWDVFLAGLSRKVRHELRRKDERLVREHDAAAITLQSFEKPEDVERLCAAVRAVYQQSWQKKRQVAERTVADNPEYLSVLAREGVLLSYALLVGGKPIAFAFGIKHGTHCHLKEIAYEQHSKSLSPGQVLIYRVLRDLIENRGMSVCSFGYGKARYKNELCNQFSTVAILWLPKSTGVINVMILLHKALTALQRRVGVLLGKLRVKQQVLTWLRSG